MAQRLIGTTPAQSYAERDTLKALLLRITQSEGV
jgi:hypothetical protein